MLLSMRNAPLMNETEGDNDAGGGSTDTGANYSGGDFNMDDASAQLAKDVFGGDDDTVEHEEADDVIDGAISETTEEQQQTTAKRAAPSSWAKEKHAEWDAMTPGQQEYVETREKQMREGVQAIAKDAEYGREMAKAIAPFKGMIQSQGINEVKAVQFLLNAHHALSSGTPAERQAYGQKLMQNYGITLAQAGAPAAQSQQTRIDPVVQELQQQLREVKGFLTQGQMAAQEAASQKIASEVSAFASDESHPYFDDCADDIVAHINAGLSLQDAYERAVWANPVTRAKEIARQTAENEAKFKERAKATAQAARSTRSTNLNGRDTQRAPTARKGTIEDVMRDVYADMNARQKA